MGFLLGDFSIVELDDGRLTKREPDVYPWGYQSSRRPPRRFPYTVEISQADFTQKDECRKGATRTLSRIDRIMVNVPMVELWEFRCHAHTHGSVGDWKLPSYQVLVRLRIQKTCQEAAATPGHQEVDLLNIPFSPVRNMNCIPTSSTLKILANRWVSSKVRLLFWEEGSLRLLRAHSNHLLTVPSDELTFGRTDFRALCRTIACLTRKNLREQQEALEGVCAHEAEKDMGPARYAMSKAVLDREKKAKLTMHTVMDNAGRPPQPERSRPAVVQVLGRYLPGPRISDP